MDALPPYNEPAVMAPAHGTGIVVAAVRTWLRYIAPLAVLSGIALAPVIAIALATPVPADPAAARSLHARGWALLVLGVLCQLVLVGGACAATRRPSQLRALGDGAVQLVRAVIPCLAAAAAIAIGSLALVVPGPILLVLLALTAAGRAPGATARLQDSIAIARRHLPAVALTMLALLAIDAAIGVVALRAYGAPLPKHPSAAQLATARHLVHAIAAALVVISPVLATVLATIHRRAEQAAR